MDLLKFILIGSILIFIARNFIFPDTGPLPFDMPKDDIVIIEETETVLEIMIDSDIIVEAPQPAWRENSVPVDPKLLDKPKIVIVIDDMGVDRRRSKAVTKLPAPLTLAYLPYAKKLQQQADKARASGHELLTHMPMQPESIEADPGPNALNAHLSAEEVRKFFNAHIDAYPHVVGFNNHMGSKATANQEIMEIAAQEAFKRGLLVLDSKTTAQSQLAKQARAHNVWSFERDVFIDHYTDLENVMKALEKLEKIAARTGVAIGIGHPKDNTILALKTWLPDVEARGFAIVPLSALITNQTHINDQAVDD